ncbi:hypothetical protein DMH04_20205 [Kibdelosporangium aridum]|uniref:Uncharacterized protein n=1 Tax=Kibdelosporangium aridum TaxID=2030 RepID=A0A428Z9Q8_KIBAR|nr:DUF5988 family protein [Kibdelosporangium aridum]RSM84797.1 hypothetical protein DMH04_20205 [Kibdelosporangium aridum]
MSANTPNAFLRGGPDHRLAHAGRIRYAESTTTPVKVLVGECYEHFQPTSEFTELDGRQLRVFSWSHRTFVAE